MTNVLRVLGTPAQLQTISEIEDVAFLRTTAVQLSNGDRTVIVHAEDDNLATITAAGCTIMLPIFRAEV